MKTLKQVLVLLSVFVFPILISNCEKDQVQPEQEASALKSAELGEMVNMEDALVVFGPERFTREKGKPTIISKEFIIENYEHFKDTFLIVIENGDENGDSRVSSAVVTVNDIEVFSPNNFGNRIGFLAQAITPKQNLKVTIELRGTPGEFFTISIKGFHYGPGSYFTLEQAYYGQSGEIKQYSFRGGLITAELINGEIVYQGDMILTDDQVSSATKKGASIIYLGRERWPSSIVYYDIDPGCPHEDKIEEAIAHYEELTPINFIKRTNQTNYIEFIDGGDGMSSHVGMVGGRQEIKVAYWAVRGKVIHEIGHALGLIHEHSRSDRDGYVRIHDDNIMKDQDHNFELIESSVNSTLFDYGSIMMYSSGAWSKNGYNTITKLDGSEIVEYQRIALSDEDIIAIKSLYLIPEVDFSASNTTVGLNEDIHFTDLSLYNPTKWEWNFGDGSWSEEQHPIHSYSDNGNKTITLTAWNEWGSTTLTKVHYIKVEDNPSPQLETFVDPRTNGYPDLASRTYTEVPIGNQIWMGENLRYLPEVSPPSLGSASESHYYVYGYYGSDTEEAMNESNYNTYGVLYNWAATMRGEAASSSNPSDVQGVCPDGWHLPSHEEWVELELHIGMDPSEIYLDYPRGNSGILLKSVDGWDDYNGVDGNGTDDYGFSAIPAGVANMHGRFWGIKEIIMFWTSSLGNIMYPEYPDSPAFRSLTYRSDGIISSLAVDSYGVSVRCVKD